MTIFRIENSVGLGPYVSNANQENQILHQMNLDHSCSPLHPMPWEDNLPEMAREYELCGFESIEKLKKWFDGWINRLYDNGFFAVQLEIDKKNVKFGNYQIVFNKNRVYSKKQLSLEDLTEVIMSN